MTNRKLLEWSKGILDTPNSFIFFFLSVSIARHLKEQILECLIFQGRKFGLDHWPVAVGEFAILYSHYLLQLVPFSIMYSSPLWEIHVLQSTAVK